MRERISLSVFAKSSRTSHIEAAASRVSFSVEQMTGNAPEVSDSRFSVLEATRGGFMKDAVIGKHHGAGAPLSGSSLLYLFVVFIAAVFALMLSISFQLNWTEYLVSTFTAAALAFVVVFTIVEMRRIGGR